MTPLIIRAHLVNGFVSSDPWSPTIDGILAWSLMRQRMGEGFMLACWDDSAMRPIEGLPLGVERHGDLWWYQASAPIYDAVGEHQFYWHRRFDAQLAERYVIPRKTGRVETKAGPYKAFRLSALVHLCRAVEWHVIGDPDAIRSLLRPVTHIGARASMGCGRVRSWEVDYDGGDEHRARFYRPLPVDFASAHGVEGPQIYWGIRPPARLRENCMVCVMPEGDLWAR